MTRRYFVDAPISSDQALLTGAEAHHAQHVMRAGVGQQITLFDGSGREYLARIAAIDRSSITLTILETRSVSREAQRQVTVGVTLPKGERQRWLIEKLTELGAAEVVPLRSARSAVHPEGKSLQKLTRSVIEACKQCGRNTLMTIGPLTDLPTFLARPPEGALRWLADPTAPGVSAGTRHREAYLAIGPEGGFSAAEQAAAEQAGWDRVGLGPRILAH